MNPIGGGEILDTVGKNAQKNFQYMDEGSINLFKSIGYAKYIIYFLMIALMALAILKLFKMKSPFKGRGITSELGYVDQVKKRDENIMRANKLMLWATKLVEGTPFSVNKSQVEYLQYNITRADVRIPGKTRVMRAEEFNAVIKIITGAVVLLGIIVSILINSMLGAVIVIFSIIFSSFVPMSILRQVVSTKDMEIKSHFTDYYLMIHYVLLKKTNTPLGGIMQSFARTTDSLEMKRYVDVCIHYIDTYGEYEATRYIARDYRELSEVGKLMRLIRQSNEGGETEAELVGFRAELISNERYIIRKRRDKLVGKARASFNILIPILVQAILSAMSIYLKDIGMVGSFMGK